MTINQTQKPKSQFAARLENQKSQLERHGNFAEVVVRTTPEGTDMINFARLWEHVLVVADRQTRGYIAKNSREDFDKTRQALHESMAFMVEKLKECSERHHIDLTGTNFISRVAQRYGVVERKRRPENAGDMAAVGGKAHKERVDMAPDVAAAAAAHLDLDDVESGVDGF